MTWQLVIRPDPDWLGKAQESKSLFASFSSEKEDSCSFLKKRTKRLLLFDVGFDDPGPVARGDRGARMTEAQSEYWATLIQAVGALHDPAALDVLLSRTVLRDGASNIAAIGAFGQPIIQRLMALYAMPAYTPYRGYISAVFVYMLKHGSVTNRQDTDRLRALFTEQSHSDDLVIRLVAAKGLAADGDPASRQRLQDMADGDPYMAVDAKGRADYPVRGQAKLLLLQMAKR